MTAPRPSSAAIIGIGCRFPGNVNSPQQFWKLLCDGVDAIADIPPSRFDLPHFYDPDPAKPGRSYVKRAGLLDRVDAFDAAFFGISRREATHIDPQQRVLLEVAWQALEDAGLTTAAIAGTRVGVFIGVSSHDFASMLTYEANRNAIGSHSLTGTASSIVANRLSYAFDLRGPSLSVDTACSSSLTAVHLACRSLRAGECDLALAGGVNLYLAPETGITMAKASMLSPDGQSKAFDASANGYVRGEGVGVVVLKPLPQASADRDRIYSIVRASAINQDGRTIGMTVPSVDAQAAMMRQALAEADIAAADVQYVEAHGTGTPTGDPVEAAALGQVFGQRDATAAPCIIGSVKTNIGHLEAAAGIAGLIKASLALTHRAIPSSLHFQKPPPAIPLADLRLRVAATLEPWPESSGPAIAGVNSFGVGGANAHVLLEAPPPPDEPPQPQSTQPQVLLLSAKTPEALADAARQTATYLRDSPASIDDIAYTAAARRTHHRHRIALVAQTKAEFASILESSGPEVITGSAASHAAPKVAFIYSGMGLQRPGMARQLLAEEPVFQSVIETCQAILNRWTNVPLLEALENEGAAGAEEPAVAQVTNFALQAALTDLWRSWGVTPDAVAGHSVGEVAAAYAAGALTLEDGLRLAHHRGRLAQRTAGTGGMLLSAISVAEAESLVAQYAPRIVLAAVNSPTSVTLSGDPATLATIASTLDSRQVFARLIPVTVPYHSPALNPLRDPLLSALQDLAPLPPAIPMASTATGAWVNASLDPLHWWNEFRNPVQFSQAISLLIDSGVDIFLEIGPHSSLKNALSECLAAKSHTAAILHSLRRAESSRKTLLRAAAALHVQGRTLDWQAVLPSQGRCVSLPTYPWQWESYGTGRPSDTTMSLGASGVDTGHPLLGMRLHSARPSWQANLADDRLSYLDGHVVQDSPVFPAAAYVETALAAARQLWPDGAAVIEQMEFQKMLVLPPGRAIATQFTADSSGAFEIHSAPHVATSWTLHAKGRLRNLPASAPPALDLPALRERCSEAVALPAWYQWYAQRGLHYAGSFRGLVTIWKGRAEALGEITLAADPTAYHLHPALLDSAFQLLAAANPRASDSQAGTLLPSSVATIRWFGPPTTRLWAHARLRHSTRDAFEGDLQLCDAQGNVIAEIERLRCLLIGASKRQLDDGVLYRVAWQQHTVVRRARLAAPPQALQPAIEAAPACAAQVNLAEYYPTIESALNTLTAAYIQLALDRLGSAAPIDTRHQTYFARLQQILGDAPPPRIDRDGCRRLAATLREAHPRWSGMIDLVTLCGESLDQILLGKVEPQEVLFSPSSIDRLSDFYSQSPIFSYYNSAIAGVIESLATGRSGSAKLRILELGAGTGGTTAAVLPKLPPASADFVFTDLSPFFLSRAQKRFGHDPSLHFAQFDAETGRTETSLPHSEFDVIIAADVLHATADLRATLTAARRFLAPNGLLILLEAIRPIAWTDFVFGLLPGWWRFTDRDLRPDHPLLSRDQWFRVLPSAGFDNVASLPELECERPAGKTVIVARRAPDVAKPWLIVSPPGSLADSIVQALATRGETSIVHQTLPPGASSQSYAGIIHLAAIASPTDVDSTVTALLDFQTELCSGIVHLLRDLSAGSTELPPLWFVTAGAQSVSPADPLINPAQACVWGLARVFTSEFPGARCHLADLSPACPQSEIEALADSIVNHDPEEELAFRDSQFFAAHVEPTTAAQFEDQSERSVNVSRDQVRLEVGTLGSLDSLALREIRPMRPGPGELLVKVHAAGLNFRDVMLAMGLLPVPEPATDSTLPLGFECAGTVVAVGPGVTDFTPGDEVIAVTHGAFASHARVRAAAAVRKPQWLSFEDAAGTLAAFTTVQHGLGHLAAVAPGERVLIHSATGGVGLAALQFCRAANAEIFATAGTPEKRALLASLGVQHVMDSRSLAFADQILEITAGQGIDVVLNSLPGEAIAKGLSILRPGGRFVEMGKRDLLDNSRIGLQPFEKTLSFFAIDLDRMFRQNTARVGRLAAEVMEGFATGNYHPLPRTDFALTDAPAAFRTMSQARHIGKIVLTVNEPAYRVKRTRAQWLFRHDATYLITGGLGGFGLATAQWMVTHGARYLVLMGRNDTPTPENAAAYKALLDSPATVRILAGDVSSEPDLRRVLDTIRTEMPPLAGVIHAAMTLDDAALVDLSPNQWRTALTSKVGGAFLLDRLTAQGDLHCFIMYSSAASIVGSPMQANYAAANAFLDSLAHNRRARGLPGLAVSFGMIAGAGYVSRQPEVRRYLDHLGLAGLDVSEALDALEVLLRSSQPHGVAGRIDVPRFRRSFPAASRRRFSLLPEFANPQSVTHSTAEANSALRALRHHDPQARRQAAERYVLGQVARVLTEPETKIDPQVPLTNLGLDSLMAVELQSLFHADLGIRIAATRLLQGVTIDALAGLILAQLEAASSEVSRPAQPASPALEIILPLANEQRRLWFLQQLNPQSPVYNVPLAARFTGPLNPSLLDRALSEVTRRHEALRATFPIHNGDVVQRIASSIQLTSPQVDLSHLPPTDREAELDACRQAEAALPFDLTTGPLIRTKLLRLASEEHVLLVTIHHLIVDAWSVPIITRDTAHIYQRLISGASPELPDPAPGFIDFIERQQQSAATLNLQLDYWKHQLAGVERLRLPLDRPHPPVRTYNGARVEFELDKTLLDTLERAGRPEGATLFMTLLAALQVLLHRYSGQQDFCIGAPVATQARTESMDRVGCLVNTLAMRARIERAMPFRHLLRVVRDTVLAAYEHQDATWEKVVEAVQPERDLSISPVFQVLLVVHHVALERVEFPGLKMTPEYTGNRGTTFDLVLLIDTARRQAAFEYNTDIFDHRTIEQLSHQLLRLFAAIPTHIDSPVSDLPFLPDSNPQHAPAPWDHHTAIHHLFERQAAKTPDAVAVIAGPESFTYAQLDRAANHIAAQLQQHGIQPESRVAIYAARSAAAVVAILATLKAGAAYVPLDPAYPQERLAFLLKDSAPSVILAQPEFVESLRDRFHQTVLPLDLTLNGPDAPPLASPATPNNLAYIIYTSGSTGRPKGVMVEHRAICNQLRWRQHAFPLTPSDVVWHTTSLSFDPSVWEIFGPLSAGAALAISGTNETYDPAQARRTIQAAGVTVVQGVPSFLRTLLDQNAFTGCKLHHIFSGGESLDNALVAQLKQATGAAVHNLYGCTETAIDAACLSDIQPGQYLKPPIGRPIGNTTIHLLDENLAPVPPGAPGEMYIAGASLARGYWNAPELTAARFIRNPRQPDSQELLYRTGDLARLLPDGAIEFLGRADRQIKLRGHRLEPDEIESCLREHPAIRSAAVALREDHSGTNLVCWYEAATAASTAQLAQHLSSRLPRFMIPTHWVSLDRMPLAPGGKIDYAALPDPQPTINAIEPAEPSTATEQRIAAIWQDLLNTKHIDPRDNFFHIGGHSLLAARLAVRLTAEFGTEVPVAEIFRHPTIAELAQFLDDRQ